MIVSREYTQPARVGFLSVMIALFGLLLGEQALGQVTQLADDLQSLRPNLLMTSDLNCRAIEATEATCVRDCDQIWLVSSRKVTNFCLDTCQLNAIQLVDCEWHASTVESFQLEHATDATLQTVFYIHGNMTDFNWSIIRGLKVYENMIGSQPDAPPVRFVIWSWPSERQTIPIRDALLKAKKAVCVGYSFRSLLNSLEGPCPFIIGYSFGAQVVLSAMQSPLHEECKGPYEITLIAPAFDRDFIHCEIDSCRIAANTATMRAYVDSKDRVIRANGHLGRKKYRRSGKCDHLISSKLNGCGDFLREIDITDCQPKHSIILYSEHPAIVEGVKEQLQLLATDPGNDEASQSSSSVLE